MDIDALTKEGHQFCKDDDHGKWGVAEIVWYHDILEIGGDD